MSMTYLPTCKAPIRPNPLKGLATMIKDPNKSQGLNGAAKNNQRPSGA